MTTARFTSCKGRRARQHARAHDPHRLPVTISPCVAAECREPPPRRRPSNASVLRADPRGNRSGSTVRRSAGAGMAHKGGSPRRPTAPDGGGALGRRGALGLGRRASAKVVESRLMSPLMPKDISLEGHALSLARPRCRASPDCATSVLPSLPGCCDHWAQSWARW